MSGSPLEADRETLGTELRSIGAELRHAQRRLEATVAASESTIREAYDAGWTMDEVTAALEGHAS